MVILLFLKQVKQGTTFEASDLLLQKAQQVKLERQFYRLREGPDESETGRPKEPKLSSVDIASREGQR